MQTTSQNVNTTRPLAHASASGSNNKSAASQQKNTLNHVSRQDVSSQQPTFAIAPSQASLASSHRAASRSQIHPSTSDQHSRSNQSTQAIEKKTPLTEKAIHTHMPGYGKSHLIYLPPCSNSFKPDTFVNLSVKKQSSNMRQQQIPVQFQLPSQQALPTTSISHHHMSSSESPEAFQQFHQPIQPISSSTCQELFISHSGTADQFCQQISPSLRQPTENERSKNQGSYSYQPLPQVQPIHPNFSPIVQNPIQVTPSSASYLDCSAFEASPISTQSSTQFQSTSFHHPINSSIQTQTSKPGVSATAMGFPYSFTIPGIGTFCLVNEDSGVSKNFSTPTVSPQDTNTLKSHVIAHRVTDPPKSCNQRDFHDSQQVFNSVPEKKWLRLTDEPEIKPCSLPIEPLPKKPEKMKWRPLPLTDGPSENEAVPQAIENVEDPSLSLVKPDNTSIPTDSLASRLGTLEILLTKFVELHPKESPSSSHKDVQNGKILASTTPSLPSVFQQEAANDILMHQPHEQSLSTTSLLPSVFQPEPVSDMSMQQAQQQLPSTIAPSKNQMLTHLKPLTRLASEASDNSEPQSKVENIASSVFNTQQNNKPVNFTFRAGNQELRPYIPCPDLETVKPTMSLATGCVLDTLENKSLRPTIPKFLSLSDANDQVNLIPKQTSSDKMRLSSIHTHEEDAPKSPEPIGGGKTANVEKPLPVVQSSVSSCQSRNSFGSKLAPIDLPPKSADHFVNLNPQPLVISTAKPLEKIPISCTQANDQPPKNIQSNPSKSVFSACASHSMPEKAKEPEIGPNRPQTPLNTSKEVSDAFKSSPPPKKGPQMQFLHSANIDSEATKIHSVVAASEANLGANSLLQCTKNDDKSKTISTQALVPSVVEFTASPTVELAAKHQNSQSKSLYAFSPDGWIQFPGDSSSKEKLQSGLCAKSEDIHNPVTQKAVQHPAAVKQDENHANDTCPEQSSKFWQVDSVFLLTWLFFSQSCY
ncbi:hypothetical protein O181_027821 [Austropuccinia psidii MF-1]|uniref:Uncharacterized protein n=1 Tax=Austropuccinia psidii MF-1 TaxID=1389203 RepID=A0A9Q3CT84_9BASI|nr:hypothetical protein [Austropuccinia psidii MF-1]